MASVPAVSVEIESVQTDQPSEPAPTLSVWTSCMLSISGSNNLLFHFWCSVSWDARKMSGRQSHTHLIRNTNCYLLFFNAQMKLVKPEPGTLKVEMRCDYTKGRTYIRSRPRRRYVSLWWFCRRPWRGLKWWRASLFPGFNRGLKKTWHFHVQLNSGFVQLFSFDCVEMSKSSHSSYLI